MTIYQPAVLIIGSGLAGLTASSTLISHSIPVLLLERSPKPGGNSIKASSGINGAPTKYQPGPPFSDTFFHADTVRSAGAVYGASMTRERESLISTLTNRSAEAVEWLVQEKGVDLSVVAQLGGHSFARTHRGGGGIPPGASIVSTLLKSLQASPLFRLETSCTVARVLTSSSSSFDNKVVTGVEYVCDEEEGKKETKQLFGPVIFTTGGFAGDANGMLARYRPDLAGFPSTNEARPGSQDLLTAVGAQVLDMEQVQIHPTSFIDPNHPLKPVKFLAAELLRGEGGVLLFDGERFVDEMGTRKVVTDAITSLPLPPSTSSSSSEGQKTPAPKQWNITLILDAGVYAHAKSHIDFYLFKNLLSLKPLSSLPFPDTTITTLKAYSRSASGLSPDSHGRRNFGHWGLKEEDIDGETQVYVGTVTPAVHFTMGGVLINEKGEVLEAGARSDELVKGGGDMKRIEGLWAAGEVTGGVHGENRLGGSSLLECVVFGRIVGEEVKRFLAGE